MPKDLIKKYLPDPESIRNNKSLRFLGNMLHDPNLWHLNRHSVSRAAAIGSFWGCMPMPLQMAAAAFCALRFNANLPISVGVVWFSNPLTMPPIFYFEYLIGAWVLDMPSVPFEYELSFSWLSEKLYEIGLPLYLGSVICGVVLSSISFVAINTIWKRSIAKKWRQRRQSRSGQNTD
jgi:hypothetical protein